MPSYRCFFIDRNEHIAGPSEVIETDGLADAIDTALALLRARPSYQGVELWHGSKRVFPSTAASDGNERTTR